VDSASEELGVTGCDYEVIQDTPGKPAILRLLGMPGIGASLRLISARRFRRATLDGAPVEGFLNDGVLDVSFAGKTPLRPWHRKLGALDPCPVPSDAEALYEATCFAADNNALEVRSLARSGPSVIPQVRQARQAFLRSALFRKIGGWDRYAFDGDSSTAFKARVKGGVFRLDFGPQASLDRVVIRCSPAEISFCEFSTDLATWALASCEWSGGRLVIHPPAAKGARYLRLDPSPAEISDVTAYRRGQELDRRYWRASNLFAPYRRFKPSAAWSLAVTLDEVARTSYLAIPIFGRHGKEGAYVALRIGGRPMGAPDRCLSFPSNVWEYPNAEGDRDYTYYVPIGPALAGARLEIVVLTAAKVDIKPEAWITAYPIPFESKQLCLE
jgi:hypothetical protein